MSAIVSTGAYAQNATSALPDPATVNLPDVTPSTNPQVRKEGYKFYYFNNPEVTFSEAYQDLAECRTHLIQAGPTPVPGFIPWDEAQRRKTIRASPRFGLVGDVMAAIILPKFERGVRSNKMRRCMGTRGYARYAIPEAVWKMLNDGDEQQMILMQAKLASAAKPNDQEVTE